MERSKYNDILRYLESGVYPERIYRLRGNQRTNAKANFRRATQRYQVERGRLTYSKRTVVVRDKVKKILQAYHENRYTGAHFGRDKTFYKIASRYYWKGKLEFLVMSLTS